jgi:DNA primase
MSDLLIDTRITQVRYQVWEQLALTDDDLARRLEALIEASLPDIRLRPAPLRRSKGAEDHRHPVGPTRVAYRRQCRQHAEGVAAMRALLALGGAALAAQCARLAAAAVCAAQTVEGRRWARSI